ncbi:MAG: hypothetical protein ACI8ZM_002853 [Crocinitomix sp.]|jgi:hypothetical protein
MKNIIFLLLLTPLALTSCKKKGCTDEGADNYDEKAKVDNHTCTYGYDQFIGSYNVHTGACDYEPNSFISTLTAGPNSNEVIMSNFNDEGFSVVATIDGNNISFSKLSGGVGYVGTGYIISTTVTVDCFICEDYNYPDDCTDSSCSYTFAKM